MARQLSSGRGGIAVDDGCIIVRPASGVSDHGRRVRPAQAAVFEMQSPHGRGCQRHRVERTVQIADIARNQFRTSHRPSGVGLGFQHQHIPAGVSEHSGGDQPIVSRPDDDRINVAASSTAATRGHRGPAFRRSSPTARCTHDCAAPPPSTARCPVPSAVAGRPRPRSSRHGTRRECRLAAW